MLLKELLRLSEGVDDNSFRQRVAKMSATQLQSTLDTLQQHAKKATGEDADKINGDIVVVRKYLKKTPA